MHALRRLALLTRDPLVERRVARAATGLGLEPLQVRAAVADPPADAPAGLLVELELDGAVDAIRRWRAAHGELIVVGFLRTPEAALWTAAEQAGADLVTTRGLADRELARLVADHLSGARRSRRIRLAAERDFAGRLGFVGRIEESPAGPIAIYHVDNRLHAVADVCPHAGAALSEGSLDGAVVTCPRHGSQFRVTDGERVRGPADTALPCFRVLVEAGDVFVELEAPR
ncbi:MAG: Rieske (2Fe-2S) protein [Thermoleophilia bacterium]